MLISSHTAATTFILLAANFLGITVSREIIIASYATGVAIDIDHLAFHGKEALKYFNNSIRDQSAIKKGSLYLHSFLQEPIAFVVLLLLSIPIYFFLGNPAIFLPTIALGVHIFMDSLMNYDNYLLWPISTKTFRGPIPSETWIEFIISLPIAALSLYLLLRSGLI